MVEKESELEEYLGKYGFVLMKNINLPREKAKRKEYMREYNKRPYVKAKRKEYYQKELAYKILNMKIKNFKKRIKE